MAYCCSSPLGRGNIMLTDVLCRWDSLDGGSCQARDDNIKARESDDKCLLSANEASDKSNCGSQEPPLHRNKKRLMVLSVRTSVNAISTGLSGFQLRWRGEGERGATTQGRLIGSEKPKAFSLFFISFSLFYSFFRPPPTKKNTHTLVDTALSRSLTHSRQRSLERMFLHSVISGFMAGRRGRRLRWR